MGQGLRVCLCFALVFVLFALLNSLSLDAQTRADPDTALPGSGETETPAPVTTEEPQDSPAPDTSEPPETDINETSGPDTTPDESPTPPPQGNDWGKYPSAMGSQEGAFRPGNILVASQMRILKAQTNARIRELSLAVGAQPYSLPQGWEGWFTQVLALYAVQNNCAEDFPYGVRLDQAKDISEFGSLYWDLTRIVTFEENGQPAVSIECKDIFWTARQLGFTNAQTEQFNRLLSKQNVDKVKALASQSIISVVDNGDWEQLLRSIPENLSGKRRAVLIAALSLRDKVSYFWAGKSTFNGWDIRWGNLYVVDREGDGSYGYARPFGMDCSGYITWVFVNAASSQKIVSSIGNGSSNQWTKSTSIAWADLRPGDLVFRQKPGDEGTNHVGIAVYLGEDGHWRIVQCGHSGKGVVLVPMEDGEFRYARRPAWYDD